MHRSAPLGAAAVAALVLALSACGNEADDPTEAEITAELSARYQSGNDPLTEEQADCYAAVVVDEIGVDRLNDVDLADETPPEDLQADLASASVRALDECELSPG